MMMSCSACVLVELYITHYSQKTDISYLTCTQKKWQICIKNWQICPFWNIHCFGSRNCQADLPGFRLTGMEVPCRCHECRCRSDLVHQGSLAPGSVNPGVFHLLNITLVPRNAAELRTVESRWKLQKVAETHDVLRARIVRDLILYVCRCGSQEMYRIMSCWCPVQRSSYKGNVEKHALFQQNSDGFKNKHLYGNPSVQSRFIAVQYWNKFWAKISKQV